MTTTVVPPITPFIGPENIIRYILVNPEEVLVSLHNEYNYYERQIKQLLNTAPYHIDIVLDFKAYRERQENIIRQVDQLFQN